MVSFIVIFSLDSNIWTNKIKKRFRYFCQRRCSRKWWHFCHPITCFSEIK